MTKVPPGYVYGGHPVCIQYSEKRFAPASSIGVRGFTLQSHATQNDLTRLPTNSSGMKPKAYGQVWHVYLSNDTPMPSHPYLGTDVTSGGGDGDGGDGDAEGGGGDDATVAGEGDGDAEEEGVEGEHVAPG